MARSTNGIGWAAAAPAAVLPALITVAMERSFSASVAFVKSRWRLRASVALKAVIRALPFIGLSRSDARHIPGGPLELFAEQSAAHYEVIGHQGFETIYKKTDLGQLTAHDVSAIDLSIFTHAADDLSSETFSLSYALTVRKQGYVISFTVDASDGSILDQPTVPFGIIR
jgi:hypothetical protein